MFMDLSKVFDKIQHELTITKVGAYGILQDAFQYYLTIRKQRCWVNSNFSTWEIIIECPFMCLGKDTENGTFIFNSFIITNSNEEKILGITSDIKLTFKSHIKISSTKSSQKKGLYQGYEII